MAKLLMITRMRLYSFIKLQRASDTAANFKITSKNGSKIIVTQLQELSDIEQPLYNLREARASVTQIIISVS